MPLPPPFVPSRPHNTISLETAHQARPLLHPPTHAPSHTLVLPHARSLHLTPPRRRCSTRMRSRTRNFAAKHASVLPRTPSCRAACPRIALRTPRCPLVPRGTTCTHFCASPCPLVPCGTASPPSPSPANAVVASPPHPLAPLRPHAPSTTSRRGVAARAVCVSPRMGSLLPMLSLRACPALSPQRGRAPQQCPPNAFTSPRHRPHGRFAHASLLRPLVPATSRAPAAHVRPRFIAPSLKCRTLFAPSSPSRLSLAHRHCTFVLLCWSRACPSTGAPSSPCRTVSALLHYCTRAPSSCLSRVVAPMHVSPASVRPTIAPVSPIPCRASQHRLMARGTLSCPPQFYTSVSVSHTRVAVLRPRPRSHLMAVSCTCRCRLVYRLSPSRACTPPPPTCTCAAPLLLSLCRLYTFIEF
ncbi:hypothetical protein DENSPDRAFT_128368 [Dentipellis sp. KUC8613]|nr:hypothetical protein DENSPDRAFT_128368 [Dentipellis sp. KUC8613]